MRRTGAGESAAVTRPAGDVLAVFAVLWALATLLHVWVNPWSQAVLRRPTLLGVTTVALALVALAVLWRPRFPPSVVLLAALGLVTCWMEAPLLGNHWLLAAFVDLALLVAALLSWRGRGLDLERLTAGFVPAARLTLITFYAFAAFAKLNSAFLDPEVSCGVFYADELKRSLHLGGLGGSSAWVRSLPVLVIAIEVAVPLLLLIGRTRHAGVALGLAYHGIIGLDMTHLFGDFSAVLTALFVLFLPPAFAGGVVDLRRRHPGVAEAARLGTLVVSAVVLGALWIGQGEVTRRLFLDGRAVAWIVADMAIVVVVGRFLLRSHPPAVPLGLSALPTRWLLVVPAFVALNGLTPYLELKTSYGWNMYSNLETVGGATNHLVVPGTLTLTDVQRDLVRIEATNDPRLALYVNRRYDLPFLQLRAYLSDRPSASLIYQRGGQRHVASPASTDPALVRPVPGWQRKVQAFRAVDQTRPVRCQPSFFPAH